MKTIDKFFEKGKKKVIIPLAFLTALTLAKEARTENKGFFTKLLDRTSIEVGIEHSFCDPLKDFYNELNENARKGNYTGGVQIPEWQDFQSPKGLTEVGGGVKVNVYKNKETDVDVFINGEYHKGKASTDHNEAYQRYNPYYGNYTVTVNRNDKYTLTTTSVGAGIEKKFNDKFNAALILMLNFMSVKGDTNMTSTVSTTNYTQWRESKNEGDGMGFSAGVDLEYKLGKNVSVSGGIGYGKGEVSTSGREISGTNYSIYTIEKDHSPKLNFNSTYLKGRIELSF